MDPFYPVIMFAAVCSLGLFTVISVAIWTWGRRREREAFYRTDMLKKIAETQGGAALAVELLREQESIALRQRREIAKLSGLVTSAAAIALMVFLRAFVQNQGPVYLAGLIPLLVGAALLIYAYLSRPVK